MSEIYDPEANDSQASRFKTQSQQDHVHSASIHRHPRMICGLRKREAVLRERLVNDKDKGIAAIEKVIAFLQEISEGPFPGFTEELIAEFECVRRELGTLDPTQSNQGKQLVAIGKRIEYLSQKFSFFAGADYLRPTLSKSQDANS